MAKRGLMSVLKGTALMAFLAVAAPTEAPAQGFDITDPTSINSPMHPLNPLNPASPINIYDDPASPSQKTPAGEENSNKEGFMLLFSVIAGLGITAALASHVDRPDKPAARSTPNSPRGKSFDL